MLKSPGQAHVVLAPGADDGRELRIAVLVNLDLTFAPPLVGMEVANADQVPMYRPGLARLGKSSKSFFLIVGFSRRKATCRRPTSAAWSSPSV